MGDSENNISSSDEVEKIIIPVWELLFDNKNEGEKIMVLDTLLNKKIKVWSVLANTVNGVRGTIKGQVGVLTSFDDEFVVKDIKVIDGKKGVFC